MRVKYITFLSGHDFLSPIIGPTSGIFYGNGKPGLGTYVFFMCDFMGYHPIWIQDYCFLAIIELDQVERPIHIIGFYSFLDAIVVKMDNIGPWPLERIIKSRPNFKYD